MSEKKSATRRQLLTGGAALGLVSILPNGLANAKDGDKLYKVEKGRIRQSVVKWCFRSMDVPTIAKLSSPPSAFATAGWSRG